MSERNPRNEGDPASQGSKQGGSGQGAGGRRSNSLQRRVQNALRWRSWGGEHDTAAPNATGTYSSARSAAGSQGRQRGRSAGSDVELSALPSTSSIGSGISASAALEAGSNNSGAGFSGSLGDPLLLDSMPGGAAFRSISNCTVSSTKSSSTGSASGRVHAHDGSSMAGQLGGNSMQQQHLPGSSAASAAGDDVCSVATQAGSAVHSFTSLHSMLLEHGEGSDAGTVGTAAAAAAAAAAAGAASPTGQGSLITSSYRGSDAGADCATSVSTLPLISEATYDDEDGQVLGFDEGSEHDRDIYNPQRSSDAGVDGQARNRASSSHGSTTSLTSDVSAGTAAATAAAAIRIPSPGFSRASFGSARGSSGSRHSLQQQQQQQLQHAVVLQQQEPSHSSSMDLPLPFSTRKRPDNDDTCSYATQAGSVHSVSSVMSSMFMDNNGPSANSSQRQLAFPGSSGGGAAPAAVAGQAHGLQHQQYFIHPLSEPDEFEQLEDLEDLEDTEGACGMGGQQQQQQLGRTDGDTAAAGAGAGAAPPSPGGEAHAAVDGGGTLERKGSLKGALRSVVAWGSGLSHKLQRAGGSITHTHSHSHKQHGAQHGTGNSSSSSSAAQGKQGAKNRGTASGQEMASM